MYHIWLDNYVLLEEVSGTFEEAYSIALSWWNRFPHDRDIFPTGQGTIQIKPADDEQKTILTINYDTHER